MVNGKNESVVVQVIDMLGKVVKQQTVELIAGSNHILLAVDNLAKGSYFILIKGDEARQKLFIKN